MDKFLGNINFVNISIVITLLFTAIQIMHNKKAIYLASIQKTYEEEKIIRTYFIKSFQQVDEIINELSNEEIDPFLIYMKDKYKELREIGTHYEYLGTLLSSNMIPQKTIFQFISAPDNFWEKTKEFREIMRTNYRQDFWINFEKMYILQDSLRTNKQKEIAKKYLKKINIC